MALNQSQLEQLLSTVKKTGTNAVPNLASAAVDTKQNSIDSLTKQISNTSARLAAVGEDATKIADTRNPLEKILNLTPDQSFIFDIFELINRPQQALFGAVEEGASGGNVLEGAIGGLTGNKDTNFKEVLQSVTKSDLGDVKGQLDLIDVVGFAGDVFLDPADLGMALVTGGSSLAGSIAMDASDISKSINAGLDLTQIGKKVTDIAPTNVTKLGDLTTGQKIAEGAQDIIFGKGKRLAKLSPEDYIGAILNKNSAINKQVEALSLTGMTMRTVGGSARTMTKFTDSLLTHGFKMLDSSGNLSTSYDGLKKFFEYTSSEAGSKIKHAVGIANERLNLTMSRFKGIDDKMVRELKEIAMKRESRIAEIVASGKTQQEAIDTAVGEYLNEVLDLFEHKYSSNLLEPNRFVDFLSAQPYMPYTHNTIQDLKTIFGEDLIEGKYTRKTFNGIDAIVFNEELFKEGSNYPDLLKAAAKGKTSTPIFDDATLKAYEKTMRLSNSEGYDVYLSKKVAYEANLDTVAKERFFKEKRIAYKGTPSQEKTLKKIKTKIQNEDLVLGKHPQSYLTSTDFMQDRYSVWLTDDERKAVKSLMSKDELKEFNDRYKKAVEAAGADSRKLDEVNKEYDAILRNYGKDNAYKSVPIVDRPIRYDMPTKEGYIRVYHNTPYKNVDSIIKSGIDVEGGNKYRTIKEYEGSGVWISTQPARGYGGNTFAFNIPEEEFAKYKVNNTEATIQRTITPNEFLFVDSTPFLNKGLSEETLRKLEDFGTVFDRTSDVIETNRKIGYDKVLEVVKERLNNDVEFNKFKEIYDTILKNNSQDAIKKLSSLENKSYTYTLINYKNKGRIRMGQWTNDEISSRLNSLMNDDKYNDVRKGVDIFKSSFREAQKTVGLTEFADEDALIKMSYEGYATHGLSKEVTSILENVKNSDKGLKNAVEYEVFAPGRTRALKGREYYGSAYGINEFRKAFYKEMLDPKNDDWLAKQFPKVDSKDYATLKTFLTETDLFSRSASDSLFNFMDNTYDAINKNHKISDALLAISMGNPGKAGAAFQNLSDASAVPTGYTKMLKDEVAKTISALEANLRFQGESKMARDLIKELKSSLRSGRMPVMENHIFEMVKVSNAATPKKALQLLDVINNGFKVGKTTSIGFNIKNFTGNAMNQWLSGVPVQAMPVYWNKAVSMRNEMKTIEKIITEEGIEALTDSQKSLFSVYREFLDAGFMSRSSIYSLQGLDSTVRWGDKAANEKVFTSLMDNPVTRANMNVNLAVDNYARLSLYLYAKDNPQYLTKLGLNAGKADAAMQAVRLVHFDPHDLTFFEDDVMKRLVPFYTFTRQNMAFQLKNLVRHSEKYRRLFKAFDMWNEQFAGLAPEDLQQYQRDQLYMPIWKKQNGELVMAKFSLPVTALSEIQFGFEDFTQNVVSKLSPVIRAPFEAATGTQTFTGQPIERYQGELSTRIPLPGVTKSTEWLMGQVGIDTALSTVTQLGQAAYQTATGQDVTQSIGKATGVFDVVNPQDAQLSKLYSTIESLSAREKVLKSKGVEIPTLDAIQSASANNKLSVQSAQLQKITDLINNIKR